MRTGVINFNEFSLDCERYELRRAGSPVKLEKNPMELLILLATSEGRLVTRQEIITHLWGDDVFVDTEHGINTAVRKVRQALQDDSDHPRFVQTVTGKGYRFLPNIPVAAPTPSAVLESKPAPVPLLTSRPWLSVALSTGVLLLLLASSVAFNAGGVRDRLFPPGPSSRIRSIAVLPLANLSGDPSWDYFADGMTDELITMLAKNPSLRVVSRTSAMQYRGVNRPVRDIARELGVDGVLEGSVSKAPHRIHMNVQLIYAPTDTHLWADSYDRDSQQAMVLPTEVSTAVARELRLGLVATVQAKVLNAEAHDAYLRGRYYWFNENTAKSEEYFRKAIQLQPDYAAAWSGLADSYVVSAVDDSTAPREVMPKAEAAAQKAVALDGSLAEAHNSLAGVYLFHHWNLEQAAMESRRAIELNPNFAEAHHLYSHVLTASQKLDEALQEQKRATELDAFARPWALGYVYIHRREYDAAINELRSRAEVPNVYTEFLLSQAYGLKGRWKESETEFETALRLLGNEKGAAEVQTAFRKGGHRAVEQWVLRDLISRGQKAYVSPWEMASQYALLGDRDQTLRWLKLASRERSPMLVFLQHEPVFDFLHSDERYRAVVREIGLPSLH